MPKVICCQLCGNLGDALLLSPVVEGIREKFPDSKIYGYGLNNSLRHIWETNPNIAGFISSPQEVLETPVAQFAAITNNFEAPETIFIPCVGSIKPTLHHPQQHMITLLCKKANVAPRNPQVRIYLAPEDEEFARKTLSGLGPKVAILHTTSFSCGNKEWYPDRWAKVVSYVNAQGYKVLQIGSQHEPCIPGAVNLLGTTMRQAFALIKHAAFFMGIDSVFNHATNATALPSVILFGPTTPQVYGYPHNINIYKKLPCQPCMDIIFQGCPVKKCMQEISVEEVIQAIDKLIS